MKRLNYFSFCKTVSSTRSPRSHDAVLLFAVLSYSASATAAGTASATGKHMFMAQYLIDSCGFNQEKATEASKFLNGIQSRQPPDSVLAFLKSYGFDDASVKRLLHYFPKCLPLDVEKTLAPKFRAFEDLGLSPKHAPILLIMSLERRLIPRHQILATLKSRGHCESDCKVTACLMLSEGKFVEKYIILFKDKYPDLSELYAWTSMRGTAATDEMMDHFLNFVD